MCSGSYHSVGMTTSTFSTQSTRDTGRWLPDTAFGRWFLSTDIWLRYVLTPAIDDLKSMLGPEPDAFDCLMDIGCGQGRALPVLADRFQPKRMLAIDSDPLLIARAADASRALRCQVETKTGSVLALDLPDNSLDAIFCHQLIHHVAQQECALRELYRVLAPGGYLLVSESCQAFISSWTVRWLFRHPPGVQRSSRGYVQLVRDSGFAVDERQIREYAPWWSLHDLGVRQRLGLSRRVPAPTEVIMIARKG